MIEALTVTSEGLASSATLDTRDGTYTNVTGANTPISIIDESFTLNGTTKTSQENAYMFIPASDQTKNFTITATLDGKTYSHSVTMSEAFMTGNVYKVNVTFTNTGLTVSQVTLVDWDETTLPETTFEAEVPTVIKVYAVSSTGELIDYNTVDATCKGVALHATGKDFDKKFMIAKSDADLGESNYYLSWDYDKGDLSITNYLTIDGVNSGGCFMMTNGYYCNSVHLSDDFTTWMTGALSDFDGKGNTAAIAASSNNASDMHKALITFNAGTNTQSNEGYNDWYIPSVGQCALMVLVQTDLSAALQKVGGYYMASNYSNFNYWTSSEYNSKSWALTFGDCNFFCDGKEYDKRVRFVRDI